MSAIALGYALLAPGAHHGSEVPDDAAGAWFALVGRNGTFTLEAVTVRVRPSVDPIFDDEGQATGREVIVDGLADPPVVLMRGPGITAGAVPTTDQGPRVLFPGDRQWLVLGPQQLEVFGVGATDDRGQIQTFGLFASPTVLMERTVMSREPGGGVPAVTWAGDLDRDGRIDVVVDTSTHYNVGELTLFLSHLDPGKLVPVAVWHTTGC